MKIKKKVIWLSVLSFFHACLLIIFTLVVLGSPYVLLEDEVALVQYTSVVKNLIFKEEAMPDPDRFVFIGTNYQKMLLPSAEVMAEDSSLKKDLMGYETFTDREALGKFVKFINEGPQDHKLILVDIRFFDKTSKDSLLAAELKRSKNFLLSYHKNEDGSPHYPIFQAPIGLSDFETNLDNGMIFKYELVQGDSLHTTPLVMYEKIYNKKFEKGWLWDYMDGKPVLNSFILDFRIRQYNLFNDSDTVNKHIEKMSKYNFQYLGEINFLTELDSMARVEYYKAFKDKIIILGDFQESDMHETIYGSTAGPLILLNAFLALEAGDNELHFGFLFFLLIAYSLISYKCFMQSDVIDAYIKRRFSHVPFGELFMSISSYIFYFGIVSVLVYFYFNIHLSVLALSFYVHFLEKSVDYVRFKMAYYRAKKHDGRDVLMLEEFKDLKVIELASVLAGPSVGQFLAELGAEVIKVENPGIGGDVTRTWKLGTEKKDSSLSSYFTSVNWGKSSVCIDLHTDKGRKEFYKLLKGADIITVSFKPGDAEKLGVDYKTVKKICPSIIYASITGYGAKDPRTGYDAIIQAESGFVYMNGEKEGNPVKMPVALIDVLAAHQLKEAILVALLRKEKESIGAEVTVSLYDAAISSLVNQGSNWLNANHLPERLGNEHPNICPYGNIFETSDKQQVLIAVGTDKQFATLCSILGLKYLAENELYATNQARVSNRDSLIPMLKAAFADFDATFLLGEFLKGNIPAGKVNNLQQTFESKEAQDLLMKDKGQVGIRQFVAKIDGLNMASLSAPPELGEEKEDA